MSERNISQELAQRPKVCSRVLLAEAKLWVLRFARTTADPVKAAQANRLADEIRLLEAMESEGTRG